MYDCPIILADDIDAEFLPRQVRSVGFILAEEKEK